MAKPNRSIPNFGSVLIGGRWKLASMTFDHQSKKFFIKDIGRKKRYGPYSGAVHARRDGLNFQMDGGRKAGHVTVAPTEPHPESVA